MHENVLRIALERREIPQITRIRELVEVDDRLVAALTPVEDEICADKSGSAGHENHSGSIMHGLVGLENRSQAGGRGFYHAPRAAPAA